MRDGEIFGMNQRRAQNEVLLYKQFQFLNTRLEAYETVLSSPWSMLKAIFSPKWLSNEVNLCQAILMKAHDDAVREVAEKKKEEAAKPKITLVNSNGIKMGIALISLLIFSGCVSKAKHQIGMTEAYAHGFKDADQECLTLQKKLATYIEKIKKQKWTGHVSEDEVTGKESWQK